MDGSQPSPFSTRVSNSQFIASFNRTIASATALLEQASAAPVQRQSLNGAEIARMAEALYGKLLAEDIDSDTLVLDDFSAPSVRVQDTVYEINPRPLQGMSRTCRLERTPSRKYVASFHCSRDQ